MFTMFELASIAYKALLLSTISILWKSDFILKHPEVFSRDIINSLYGFIFVWGYRATDISEHQ